MDRHHHRIICTLILTVAISAAAAAGAAARPIEYYPLAANSPLPTDAAPGGHGSANAAASSGLPPILPAQALRSCRRSSARN
jgi:hypothetical protein